MVWEDLSAFVRVRADMFIKSKQIATPTGKLSKVNLHTATSGAERDEKVSVVMVASIG